MVYGVGINDADYHVQKFIKTNGSNTQVWCCPFYLKWRNMLKRCYSIGHLDATYEGCSVCDEWLIFSNFKSWMEQQDWEGKHLDKDLLVEGNKVYSPDTCAFITRELNNTLLTHTNGRGMYPLGVCYVNNRRNKDKPLSKPYYSCIRIGGKTISLGAYNNVLDAHLAWQRAKIDVFINIQKEVCCYKTKKGIQRIIDKLEEYNKEKIVVETL